MNRSYSVVVVLACLLGCEGSTPVSVPPTNNGPVAPAKADSPTSGSPTSTSGTQVVEGPGFNLQIPTDWRTLPVSGGVALTSPLDLKNPTPPLSVSVAIVPIPAQAPGTSADAAQTLLKAAKMSGEVESETQITVSGRAATKLIQKKSIKRTETSEAIHRSVKVFCPIDNGVFALQVDADEKVLTPLMPQLESIINSIKFKP